jgi:uncharacterized protein YjbI with pentapeptide repeats
MSKKKEVEPQDLKYRNLAFLKLNGVDLTDADLTDAILSGAYLNDAKLNNAKLNGANLNGAKLNGAELKGAKLNGAILGYADLTDVDLTLVDLKCSRYLATAKHENILSIQPINKSLWAIAAYVNKGEDLLAIGCQPARTIDEWEAMNDEEIRGMEEKALEFWQREKEHIIKEARRKCAEFRANNRQGG